MTDEDNDTERFKHFPLAGECNNCGSFETMYTGFKLIDEKCCNCGIIIGGGYLNDTEIDQ